MAEPDAAFHLRICFGNAGPDVVRWGVCCLAEIIGEQLARPLAPPASADGTPLV